MPPNSRRCSRIRAVAAAERSDVQDGKIHTSPKPLNCILLSADQSYKVGMSPTERAYEIALTNQCEQTRQ